MELSHNANDKFEITNIIEKIIEHLILLIKVVMTISQTSDNTYIALKLQVKKIINMPIICD